MAIRRIFGDNISQTEIADTALAAKKLAEGSLPNTTAAICRKSAGKNFGLTLIEDNIEDDHNNQTEFRLYKMSEVDYTGMTKPKPRKRRNKQDKGSVRLTPARASLHRPATPFGGYGFC